MTKKLFLLLSVLLLKVGAFSQNHSIIKEFKNLTESILLRLCGPGTGH
jgi:hypothetical protein